MKTNEIVAVKVIKNKPAYYNQSMMEVTILDLLNNTWDASDEHHLLRLKDQFIHHRHLCLVFELLSVNLYELIKQNSFRGLSSSLVRVFTGQLLDSLTVLNEARLIHCDLKPENILLKRCVAAVGLSQRAVGHTLTRTVFCPSACNRPTSRSSTLGLPATRSRPSTLTSSLVSIEHQRFGVSC